MQLGLSTTDPVVLLAQRYPAQECEEVCKSSPGSKVCPILQRISIVFLKFVLNIKNIVQEDMDRETERLELDFSECLWCSYRTGFSPLGKGCSTNIRICWL